MKLPVRLLLLVTLAAAGWALPACTVPSPVTPPGDVPIPPRNTKGYVGLPKSEALTRAAAERRRWRVVREEGESVPVTRDYQPGRLNFTIERGVVVHVTKG